MVLIYIDHFNWSHITVTILMLSKFLNIDKPWLNFLQKHNDIHLPLVSGNWLRPRPYHQRLCDECEMLGDESHFLFLCERLNVLRSKYISRCFWTKPSMNKFVEQLSSEYSKTINNLAILVYFGLEVSANLWKKAVIICRCYKLLYSNGIIILSPRSDTAHIVYIALYYVFAHRAMGLCWEELNHTYLSI